MRKKWLLGTAILAGSIAFGSAAYAVPQLQIEVFDNGVLVGASPVLAGGGPLVFNAIDPNFSAISVTSTGVPILPSPGFGTISINISAAPLAVAHTLTILATQTGLTPTSNPTALLSTFTYNALTNAPGVSFAQGKNFVDSANVAFGTTGLGILPNSATATLIAQTTNQGGLVINAQGPMASFTPTPGLFSETEVYTLTFLAGQSITQVQTSDQIVGPVPEPVSLALLGTGLIGLAVARARRRD